MFQVANIIETEDTLSWLRFLEIKPKLEIESHEVDLLKQHNQSVLEELKVLFHAVVGVQWNLSITVTLGTKLSGHYTEVACL